MEHNGSEERMKYESKFGIGEIVVTKQKVRDGRIIPDLIGEVFAVHFGKDATMVAVRLTDGTLQGFREDELEGDPAYDQETGSYPDWMNG